MGVLNIHTIIDVATIISSTPPTRRDFAMLDFLVKQNTLYNDARTNYFTNVADVIEAYGSNTEAAKAAGIYFGGGFNGLKPTGLFISTAASGEEVSDVMAELIQDPRYYHMAIENGFSISENEDFLDAINDSSEIPYFAHALTRDTDTKNAYAQDLGSIARREYDAKFDSGVLVYDDEANKDEYKQMAEASIFGITDFNPSRPLPSMAFKQVSGITATDLTNNEATNLMAKNVNFYAQFGEVGRSIFYKGKTPKGTFANVIIGRDWLSYQITYNIFDLMTTVTSIAYTTEDFNKLLQAIDSACQGAVAAKILAPGTDSTTGIDYPNGYDIAMPDPKTVSAADKAAGNCPDILITAMIAGTAVKFSVTNYMKY